MANDSDVAQARILLSALNDHIARISGLLEKAERWCQGSLRPSLRSRSVCRWAVAFCFSSPAPCLT